ncbi:hypothetical protein KEM48_002346 [Puccinia striiformis f. sp. tritici PST-130]|nr:hypothetical protein KEM48_002346 [Puccinia striiformis f. sp. tritici PST-130]
MRSPLGGDTYSEVASHHETRFPRISTGSGLIGEIAASERRAEMPKEPLKSGKILKLKPTMEEEFASFLGEIQWLEQTIQDQHTAYYHLRETRFRGTLIKRNRRLLENLKTLQEIHRLMPTSRKDRLFRLVHKGLVLEPLEPMELNEKSMPRCVFRTADLIDRHRLVPPGHLESFLQLKDTLPFASITVHEIDKVAENREPV